MDKYKLHAILNLLFVTNKNKIEIINIIIIPIGRLPLKNKNKRLDFAFQKRTTFYLKFNILELKMRASKSVNSRIFLLPVNSSLISNAKKHKTLEQ